MMEPVYTYRQLIVSPPIFDSVALKFVWYYVKFFTSAFNFKEYI